MSEVFERNIAKLKKRYPNGYSSEDSKARVDTLSDVDLDAWGDNLDRGL